MKKKFRQIVVQGQTYLWRFTSSYVASGDLANPWQCRDCFTAYLSQTKASPLRVFFLIGEDAPIGWPRRTPRLLDLDHISFEPGGINLHTPKDAAWIIQKALEDGWKPEQSKSPFVIEQGTQWFMQKR